MVKILFICHGNICRSPMAEFVMKDLIAKKAQSDATFDACDWIIESAATTCEEIGHDTHRGTKRMLDAHHIPYTRRAARHITPKDYERFDYLIGMDAETVMISNDSIPVIPPIKYHCCSTGQSTLAMSLTPGIPVILKKHMPM